MLKVLAQLNPVAATLTTLYTVPAATSSVVTGLVVANRSSTPTTFRVSVADAGAADNPKQYISYDLRIEANDVISFGLGVTLSSSDVVRCYATLATLSFSLFGDEIPVSIYWGARIDGAFYQTNYGAPTADDAPWSAAIPGDGWDLFETHAGKKISCVHWGGSGTSIIAYDTTAGGLARSRGAFSLYSMGASTQDILDLAANSNTNGVLTRVDTWSTAVQNQGYPVMLRPWHEMNGNWGYPWQTAQGVSAANFILAWQTLYARVNSIASNVSFVWCPNVVIGTTPDPTPWFPGAAYLEWMGMDGYAHAGTSNESVAQVFGPTYSIFAGLAPTKPFAICETGVSDTITSPTKAAWITDLLTSKLPLTYPKIKLINWFNEAGNPTNPFIEIAPYTGTSAATFAAGIASNYYKINTSLTFTSRQKIPLP